MHPRITIDPRVMFGKPVIRGTRITVEMILRKLSAEQSLDDIIASHPHVTREDILAAIAFAADQVASDEFVLTTAGME